MAATNGICKPRSHIPERDWEAHLSEDQFAVCRLKATEIPFSGRFYDHFEKGTYSCVCCGTSLFRSSSKFESGCGWPSFSACVEGSTIERPDFSRSGRARTEVLCSKCESHLGHVFPDGPQPSGLRYCINSVCLDFKPENS